MNDETYFTTDNLTESTMLTREEILENAALDILGLLTSEERFNFERLLQQADHKLLVEVKRIQDSILLLEDTLPDVSPDISLRQRVLSAVGQMIERDLRASVQENPSGRIYTSWRSNSDNSSSKREIFERFIGGKVSPIWRMGALIAATLAIAFGYVALEISTSSKPIIKYVTGKITQEEWAALEARISSSKWDIIFDDATEEVFFKTLNTDYNGMVKLWYHPQEKAGVLIAKDLPKMVAPYRLCLDNTLSEPQKVVVLAEFYSLGGVTSVEFDLGEINKLNNAESKWSIMAPGSQDGPDADIYTAIMQSKL